MAAPDLTASIDALKAEVARTRGVHDSAVALITGIAARVEAAVIAAVEADDAADEGTLTAVREAFAAENAALAASTDALANAVSANP